MQDSFKKKRLLTKRILPLTLVLVLIVSIVAVAFGTFGAGAAGVAQGETVYFNLSKNSSWYTNGNGTLYARFYSGNTPVGNAACSMQATNIYKATAPAAADSVRLAVYFDGDFNKDIVLALSAPNRVFFDNASTNWAQPYVYNWKDANTNAGAWPGKKMTYIDGSSLYYYDVTDPSFKYLIFNNNSGSQTPDLTVPGDPAYWNGNGWTEVFTKSTSKLDLSSKPSDANEIYLDGSNLVLSRYQYPNHNNLTTRQIYVYNPNWTGNQVSVFFDLSDPYQKYVTMTKVTTDPNSGKTLPAGYYKATVPISADIKFFATNQGIGGSNPTKCPSDSTLNCYKMGSGAEKWVRFADAPKITATYFADKKTTGESNSSAFWVDAVYYDYLSDTELNNGWLKPSKVGTKYNASEYLTPDDWYPFKRFNAYISSNTSGVTYPLYFGNFCNTAGAYPIMYDNGQNNLYTRNGGYAKEILKYKNFSYIADNSNGFFINNATSSDYNYSVQGLARNTLNSNGDIVFPNGTKMPYFQQSTVTQGYAESVQSYFPFRHTTNTSTGVTRYTFNSKNATDNVFFKWSNSKPASVNYGQGTNYGVKDGLADFNYPDYQNNKYRGYGIFPFNNKNNGNSNPGNGNLDYGFGVRMDMNFRVPKNGTLDGTTGGEAVKFSFTGDDDLWVYLTPVNDDGTINYSKSQLALDLGGAHKEASGNINFKTMQSTVSKGAVIKTDSNVNEKTMLVQDVSNWGVDKVRVWAWKEGQNGRFYSPQRYYDGKAVFSADQTVDNVKLGDNDYFKLAKGNWEAESPSGSDSKVSLQGHFGRITYTDNPEYTPIDESYRWRNTATNKTTSLDTAKLGLTRATTTLDPTKLYHMTVFYMERGLIESNCSMEFTMTPAQNDYKVEKIVNTADVNTGVEEWVQQKDSFNFTTRGTFGKSSVNRTTSLTDKQVKDYNNQFDTNTNLQTSETGAVVSGTSTASNTEYTTTWSVADIDAGEYIAKSANGANSKSTNKFVLKRKDGTNDSIHLKSTFVNTPVTDDVQISKQIVEEDGSPSNKIVTFNYVMTLDLDGSGERYQEMPFPLDYTVGGHAAKMDNGGNFSFRSDQTVIVPNLPKNATFTVYEVPSAGFVADQASFKGKVGTLKTVQFTNRVKPSTDKIVGCKKLNGSNYTGGMFTFKLEGLPAPSGAAGYVDESNAHFDPITQITNGAIEFKLVYKNTDVGRHRYKFYEDTSTLGALKDDFYVTDSEWYVEVNVVSRDGELVVDSIDYFKPAYVQGATNSNGEPVLQVDIDETFAGEPLEEAEFKNDVVPGSITVVKTDNTGEYVDGIEFDLYKVSGKNAAIPAGATPFKTDVTSTKQDGTSYEKIQIGEDEVDYHGVARFADLPIYKDMSCSEAVNDPYQWYCLVEKYDGTDNQGYNANATKMYFKFPTNGKYDFKAEYLNNILKQPQTSGDGMQIFKIVGLAIIGFSVLAFGAYLVYVRTPKRGTRYIKK